MPNENNDKETPKVLEVKAQVTLQLLSNGGVNVAGPKDMAAFFYIIGEAIKQMGLNVEYKQPSPIIKPPPGMKVKP